MSNLPDRLQDRIFVCPFSGCWLWTGGDTGDGKGGGYGKVWWEGRMQSIHRVLHRIFIGPIPMGYQVDHLCARWSPLPRVNRRCCNPDHLEATPNHVNNQRRFRR